MGKKRYLVTIISDFISGEYDYALEYQNYLRGGKAINISVGRTRSKSGY